MAYLIKKDFNLLIQTVNLNQVIGSDDNNLAAAIQAAEAECLSYLRQKYDTEAEFIPVLAYEANAVYKVGARVYKPDFSLYYAKSPYPEFNYQASYRIGDKVFYKNSIYTSRANQTYQAGNYPNVSIQYGFYQNVPGGVVFPDDPYNGVTYWGQPEAYNIPVGSIDNTTYFLPGDTRDSQLKNYCIDIALYHVHARITPNNVPELREVRYNNAVAWLKMCANGDVTAQMPVKQPRQGARIRYGGNVKQINSY